MKKCDGFSRRCFEVQKVQRLPTLNASVPVLVSSVYIRAYAKNPRALGFKGVLLAGTPSVFECVSTS